MLGADTRSTAGSTVADKNCEKIHHIAPNIYCCGAGTAADTENVTGGHAAGQQSTGPCCELEWHILHLLEPAMLRQQPLERLKPACWDAFES